MPSAERALPFRHAVALGLLQGPTELLPISSSGHTTLIPWLAGWPYARVDGERRKSFEVALHAGAGVGLALHMRGELLAELRGLDRRRASVLALSLAPPALAGYALRPPIERWLGGPRSIAVGLAAGAVAMALADRAPSAQRTFEQVTPMDGLALGFAQAAALIPGVSRSGATLTAARARGFSRPAAHALCWHSALPVIFAATALKGGRLARSRSEQGERAVLAGGGASAFVSTLACAAVLRKTGAAARPLIGYSLYRGALAALVLRRANRGHAG